MSDFEINLLKQYFKNMKMNRCTKILTILFTCFLLSCTPLNERDFYVVGKKYIPEHAEFDIVTLSDDIHRKEEFVLYIADSLRVHKINVTEEVYKSYNKGDKYIF